MRINFFNAGLAAAAAAGWLAQSAEALRADATLPQISSEIEPGYAEY